MDSISNQELCFFITEEWEEERIDKALNGLIDSLSRSYIQKILKDGRAMVNGKVAKANCRLKYGDEIKLKLPAAEEPEIGRAHV